MTETERQIQVVTWLYSLKSKKFEFFATLNEALLKGSAGKSKNFRYAIYQKLLKMGLKTGIPDIVFLVKGGKVFFIEMKTPTGTLSKNQKFRIPIIEALGFDVHICRSLDDVKKVMSGYGLQA
jgi:hypothetical protein